MPNDSARSTDTEGLITRHVYLDTQVYKENNFAFDNPLMNVLIEHVEGERILIHTTDIVLAEVERHIKEDAEKLGKATDDLIRDAGRWAKRFRVNPLPNLEPCDAAMLGVNAWNNFRSQLQKTLKPYPSHSALKLAASEVFGKYLARKPLFEGTDKEFPDAFALASLEHYCNGAHCKMYVVTADVKMQRAATESKCLLPVRSLRDLLATAATFAKGPVRDLVSDFLSARISSDELFDHLAASQGTLGVIFDSDIIEAEIVSHALIDVVDVDEYYPISATSDTIGFIATFGCQFEFGIEIESRTFATYDREDDQYYNVEKYSEKFTQKVPLRAFVVFDSISKNLLDLTMITRDFIVSDKAFR